MDDKLAELFKLVKKNNPDEIWKGDDVHMGSVAPYGITSGLAELDLFLGGTGGYPAGKIIEFYGKPMCGKTTAALQVAAEWQKQGGGVHFVDAEVSFSPKRAKEVGCVPEHIIKSEPNTIEGIFSSVISTLDYLEKVNYDKPFLFIVDSVTGVPTLADLEGNIDDNERVGHESKQIKRGCKKVNPRLSQLKCKPTIIFITHSIAKIVSFGKQSDSGGGNGIKFYSSVRVEFAHLGNIKNPSKDKRIGQKINITIEKLKGASLEFPKFTAELLNVGGFDRYESLKLAMVASGFAKRPKGAKVITMLPDTPLEAQAPNVKELWQEWINEQGGYDSVYLKWRKWAISVGVLKPWGGANA